MAGQKGLREIDAALGSCQGVEIRELTIEQAHAHFATRRLTPAQLTKCYLDRIAAMNPRLNAVIEVNPDAETLAAQLLDTALPLYGIPILLKDNIATADALNTTAGSDALLAARPEQDAEVVLRLRRAGAIILGKANQSEMNG